MKKDSRAAYIALGLVSVLWGTTYIASKIGAQHMPGLFLAGLRQFASGVIMVGFFLARGYKLPDLKSLKAISIQGIFLLCFSNGMLTWSLEFISGGLAAIIAALVPLMITLMSIWLLKHAKFTKWMVAGLLIGFSGVVVIFYDYLSQLANKSFLFGVVLALLATVSWAFGSVYNSQKKLKVDVLFNVGLQMLIAGFIMLVICLVSGKYVNPVTSGISTLYALSYLIVFGSLIAYSAYVFAITKLPPAQVSIYAYINPIVAVLLGWMMLNEKMNLNMIFGTLITLLGVYVVNREFKKQKSLAT
ncbi:MAG TPA: EamA family transporter [Chitinophagaceae bacterium]|nr:EamA family transporter [Chitinophagaceae bacterium]